MARGSAGRKDRGDSSTLNRAVALLTAAVFASSCATFFKGSNEKVTLNSEPPGASVFLNGLPLGETPTEVLLASKSEYSLEFRKDGYHPRGVVLTHSLGAGWFLLDVLFIIFFVPIIVDVATGDWYYLQPTTVRAVLEPVAPPAPSPVPTPPATPGR